MVETRARIAFAIPELDAGGPDRVIFELLSNVDRSRFEPHLIVGMAGGRYYERLHPDIGKSAVGGGRYPVRSFARTIDRLRPDLVLATLRMTVTSALAMRFQSHRPPLVARQANAMATNSVELQQSSRIKHLLTPYVIKHSLRVPTALVAQSADMAVELKALARPRQSVYVIGNPVSVDVVDAEAQRQAERVDAALPGDPALVAVGRLAHQKGFDMLIEAFERFRRVYPGAHLTILGEGPDRAALTSQTTQLGLSDVVHLPGQSDTPLGIMASADVVVSSSRYEGFSNVLLEAMALGKLVVATNAEGGTSDMVVDGDTGVLSDSVSVDGLEVALKRAMRVDSKALGSSARQHVAREFGTTKIIADYERLFDDVLGDGADVAATLRNSGPVGRG